MMKVFKYLAGILAIIIVIGGSFFASELKYCKSNNKDVELEVINTLEGAFHGIYDYQSSNYMLMKVYEYLKEE